MAELTRYVDIDIFGKCAGYTCNKRKRSCVHMKNLIKTHKFYFTFENSLCTDYITEKVWTRLQQGIVPVILGVAHYKTFLPPHSYINVKGRFPRRRVQSGHRFYEVEKIKFCYVSS